VNVSLLRRGLVAAATVFLSTLVTAQAADPAPPVAPSAKSTAPGGAKADTKAESSYSVGLLLGTQLHNAGLGKDSLVMERLFQGMRDALSGTAKAGPADQVKAQGLVMANREKLATNNRDAAKKFLAENGKQKGVTTTADGLEYKVLSPGSGASPKPTDSVTVNYRGTLLDGTEFDSSYKRGQPAQFQVDGVIKGWQEALVLMKPGAKWELYIPPELAYDLNSPPPIPPGSMLKFEVELVSVKPPTAAAAPKPGAAAPKIVTPAPQH
jgi:FKBP-type peptidyl-prolyl cis-trans isomerase FkpA